MSGRYPWHATVWQKLMHLVEQNKVPHAILLTGITGLGKTALLHDFAALLLCAQHNSCGHCRACHLFSQQSHPDYFLLGQEETIGIDDVREIIPFLQQTAHQSGLKVVTLLHIDNMLLPASNALLKTLEEPPANTHLLLTCDNLEKLLPTIKSRCTILSLLPPSLEAARNWLQHPNADLALKIAANAPLKARSLLASSFLEKQAPALYDAFFVNKTLEITPVLQEMIAESFQEGLHLLYYWLMDRLKENHPRDEKIKILKFMDELNAALKALSISGLNKQLLLERLLFLNASNVFPEFILE